MGATWAELSKRCIRRSTTDGAGTRPGGVDVNKMRETGNDSDTVEGNMEADRKQWG